MGDRHGQSKTTPQIHQMSIAQFQAMFPKDACCAYLVGKRWPKGVRCPRCGSERVKPQTRKLHWECPDCRQGGAYRFLISLARCSRTPISRPRWYRVIHLMLTARRE
jgi:hypothetical protein